MAVIQTRHIPIGLEPKSVKNNDIIISCFLVLTVSILVPSYSDISHAQVSNTCANQPLTTSITSGSEAANPPSNAIDNDLSTRWSNVGPSWIMVDLGSIKTVCSVDIAWYRGDLRQNNFDIRVWDTPAQQWKIVFSGKSSGGTAGFERYHIQDTSGRYVAIFVYDNTENNFASISEIDVNTKGSAPSSELCGNGIDDDKDGLIDEVCSTSGSQTDPFE